MKMQRLQIRQELAQIKIESQMAGLSIDMPIRRMSVEQQSAKMTIEQEAPDIELDMQEFRNNIGLKSNKALMQTKVAQAQAQAQNGIKQMSADGDFVGTLPSEGNKIGQLARNKLLKVPPSTMNSGKVPGGAIKMDGKPGKLEINWAKHDIKIKWDDYETPTITVQPKPSVHVEMVKEPVIEYTVIEQQIPAETGNNIDAQI